ncbi:hypothetical protein, partial [Actinomyces oris]|uniref:hypothetical protein n=1 Tax=Actinomyces oris TaxID=544580 RepID=UPI002852ACA1
MPPAPLTKAGRGSARERGTFNTQERAPNAASRDASGGSALTALTSLGPATAASTSTGAAAAAAPAGGLPGTLL